MKDYKNLGYVNDWRRNKPIEYLMHKLEHEENGGHNIEVVPLNNGGISQTTLREYRCHTCRIVWRIDSSD